MKEAPLPPNETERLKKLRRYEILDTLPEQEYDEIVELVAYICYVPISNISLVDSDRQWFKAAVGLDVQQTPRDRAFCAHTILDDKLMVVHDAAEDERFHDNPLVAIDPRIRFYAGMPLTTPDGYRLGALCAIDLKPRELTERQERALETLARHVINLFELRIKNREVEAKNRALQEYDQLKTRLMSIMAHDLRRPMINLGSLVQLIRADELDEAERAELLEDLNQLLDSTNSLLENVLGWAKHQLQDSRLQYGEVDLGETVEELFRQYRYQLESKGNSVVVAGGEPALIVADRNVVAFLLRNLVTNANKFTTNGTITVSWYVTEKRDPRGPVERGESGELPGPGEPGEEVVVEVADTGVGMSQDQLARLFDWSGRATMPGTDGEKGAGLALLLCQDFVSRHGGSLEADSAPGEGSVFRIRLPRTVANADSGAGGNGE